MKSRFFVILFVCTAFAFTSCVSTSKTVVNGIYYSDKDEVVLSLDVGMLEYYNQNYEEAINELTNAEKKIDEFYTKSISQNIESFLTNDYVIDYPGEDYEDIYINIFKAMSYYQNNQWEEGFHELNAYKRKAEALGQKHNAEIELARNKAQLDNSIYPSVEFHDSALAEYLFMLYYRSIFDRNQVEYAARMLKDVFITSPNIYDFSIPETIDEELNVEYNETRLNFLVYSGVSPYKTEEVHKSYYRNFILALPVLVVPKEKITSINVMAKNTETEDVYSQRLEKIEDFGNIATDVFKARSDLIYSKSVARALTKATVNTTTGVTGLVLMDSDNPQVATLGRVLAVSSYIGKAINEEVEKADLRHSHYFPGRADVGGMTVEPGNYNIIVQYLDRYGNVLYTDKMTDVKVNAGKLNLVTSSSTIHEQSNTRY